MGLLTSSSSARRIRAQGRAVDAQLRASGEELGSTLDAQIDSSVAPLLQEAERFRTERDFRDPLIEQALEQGLRKTTQGQQERANVASGVSGGARGDFALQALGARTQGFLQAESRRVTRRREDTQALVSILGQAGQIKAQGATTRIQALSSIEGKRADSAAQFSLAAEQAEDQPTLLANILGGAVTAFAGGAGGALLGAGISSLFSGGGGQPGAIAETNVGNNFADTFGRGAPDLNPAPLPAGPLLPSGPGGPGPQRAITGNNYINPDPYFRNPTGATSVPTYFGPQ